MHREEFIDEIVNEHLSRISSPTLDDKVHALLKKYENIKGSKYGK